MFGQSSFGGFGQSQPAFGSTPTSSPFGGSTAFGAQQPSPFGATPGTGVFGASQPAFGAASTPAFGAPQSQGGMFGSTGFGAKPATGGFAFGGGATAPSPFGAPSQPAFGAPASTPAFGGFGAASTPAFGASSSPAFGASSTPAFGGFGAATSTPAFGAPAATPAFGSAPAVPSPFGAAPAAGGFGAPAAAQQQQNMGSRVAPYQKHQDKDTSSSSAAPTTVYYVNITAMPQYVAKSVEELRWEDYQAGVKNASSAPAPAAAAGGFGAPAAGGFGFGASSSPAFGASSAAPFGASSSPAFGASSPSPFGAGGFGSTPAASTPAFGGFGASSSTPAAGTGLFGAAASQPASSGFSFGGSSTPAFGAPSSTATFGAASTPSVFGGSTFGASSGGGLFGAASTPAFGAPSASSPFGASSTPAFGTPSSSPFGASTPAAATTGFGAPASTGFSFGTPGSTASKPATGFSFGGQPASTGGLFGAPASTGSLFGASSTPAFGSTGGGLFGSTPSSTSAGGSSLFGGTSTFGAAAPTGGGLFGTPPNPAQGSAPGATGFSFGPAAAQNPAAAAPVAPATVGQQPYGALQPLPQVNVPEHKVGITQRPVRAAVTSMRPSPLLTLRTNTPKFGLGISATGGYSNRPSSSSSGGSPFTLNPSPAAADNTAAAGGRSGSPAAVLLLPVRDNPHKLFIRSPPPSTTPAGNGSSLSPAMGRAAAAGEDSTPVKTPATRRTSPYHPEAPLSNGTAKQQPAAAAAAGDEETRRSTTSAAAPGSEAAAGAKAAAAAAAAASPIGDAPRLGKLAAEGYSMVPSERELQQLSRQNPGALARVSGFKIRRVGYGSLEWLVPVDVRGADLEQIVQIERGEVSLYMDEDGTASEHKPPEGSGLNCPCRVTLTGVYKKSKQAPDNAAAATAAFRKRLQKYCVDMGAKFVDYQAEGGMWIFEVEHFSRYGLPSDDSDEELGLVSDGMEDFPGKQQQPAGGSQQSQEPEYTFGGAPDGNDDSDADMANDVTQHVTPRNPDSSRRQVRFSEADMMDATDKQGLQVEPGGEDLDTREDAGLAAQQQQQQGLGLGSVPLQHALPALLAQSAEQLMELREGLFFREGGPAAAAAAVAAAAASVSPMQIEQRSGSGLTRQRQQWAAAAAAVPEHNWVRPRPALLQQQQQRRQPSSAQKQQQQQLMLYGGDSLVVAAVAGDSAAAAASALVVSPLTARAVQSFRSRQQSAGAPSIASAAVAASKIGGLMPTSVAISNSSVVVDASLMLGRSFRVSWGPNGMLAIPQNPALGSSKTPAGAAAADASGAAAAAAAAKPLTPSGARPDEAGVPYLELRQLQPIAAVAGSSSSSNDVGVVRAAAAAAMQQRIVSGLELHLQYSSAVQQQDTAAAAAAGDDDDDDHMQDDSSSAAAAAAPAAQWQLNVDRKQLSGFIREQDETIAQAAATMGEADPSINNAAAATGCGQHLRDLWQLVRVLYEYIDGEDDTADGNNMLHQEENTSGRQLEKESDQGSADEADGEGLEGLNGFKNSRNSRGGSRTQLAAFQRKAALSQWLQRKVKPAVTAAVHALQSNQQQQQQQDVLLWSLLHLMTGHQVAAAVSVAVAVGDVRLATLLAAAGQAAAAAGSANVGQQLQVWARAGVLPGHISTPRRLLLALLAAGAPGSTVGLPGSTAGSTGGGVGGLLEVCTALGLEWSRAFGLWMWYGVPFTEPVAAVTRAFTAALAAAPQLPRPIPPHGSLEQQQQQRNKVTPADTQYALLQLHALGTHGLGLGLLNSYPEEEGLSSEGEGLGKGSSQQLWREGLNPGMLVAQLLRVQGHSSSPLDYSTAWQLLMVLQSIGALSSRKEEYEQVSVAIASSFISQLLLLGPAASCWAPFVALHIPDSLLLPGSRAAALQQLLQVTAPQWAEDPSLVGWLRSTLQLPLPWLHDAQATWFGYSRRYSLQLLHLIAAGNWHSAHDLTCRKVAPLLALAATGSVAVTDAAVADFAAAAGALLDAVGEDAAAAAAAAIEGDGTGSSSSSSSLWWADAATLRDEPTAPVAAAAYVAAAAAAATTPDQGSESARAAAVALRALCRVLGAVRGVLGSSWQLGAGVYSAWCGVFLDPAGNTHDPAAVAVAGGAAAAGEAVERCLHLSDLLPDVAADGGSGGSCSGESAWWGSPMQRMVLAKMTSDVGRALVRLGISSSSSSSDEQQQQQQQQQAPLVVPLAALGASLVGGSQSAAQLLAGAAADIAASCCTA